LRRFTLASLAALAALATAAPAARADYGPNGSYTEYEVVGVNATTFASYKETLPHYGVGGANV
jgi:hypothetical protein